MRRKLLVFTLLCICSLTAFAQEKTIQGKVTDENATPLSGVSVTVKGSAKGTVTDREGVFTLSVPDNARTVLFSFVNYVTQEVALGNKTFIQVQLLTEEKALSEVVVVGYGTQRKKELTGSVAQVKGTDLANRPLQGPDQALRGQVAGVTVTQSSGTPGSSMNVNIRGTGSINASSQPLYVVDGVPINTGSYSQIGVGGQTLNSLADINPNEIESYEILKDAAATAIYGSRAANGVVLITTKRGANKKTKINLSTYYGISNVAKKIPVLTGPQYVELVQESIVNRYGAGILPSAIGLVGLDNAPSTFPTTNWQDEIFTQGSVQNHDISAQGGNDKTRFFVSGSYFDQNGIVLKSDFKRYNFRLNLDNKVTDKFKVSTGIGLSRSVSNRLSNDNNIYGVVSTSVLLGSHIPAYNANGTYGRDPNSSTENPLANAYEVTNLVANNRILANISGEYEILKNLSFKSLFGVDFIGLREQNFIPSTHLQAVGVRGDGIEGYTQDFNWINENILTYKKSFGAHAVAFTGVASFQESVFESVFARAQNFPGNQIRRLSAGSVRVNASSTGSSWGLAGYIGRVNYAFKDKYLVSGSLRRDGVSRFGENKRWGTFPAVSGAWRISEEAFMSKVKFISDLKIRGSYGRSGNSSVADFASLSLVGAGVNYLQTAGLSPVQLGNPNLGWEESEQTDIGLEMQLFQRINVTAEYYIKNTNDLLLARLLPGSSGFLTVTENIGKLQNKGFELGISGDIIRREDWNWNVNFNITFPQNKVIKLAGSPIAQGFASWVEEGKDLGSFRGYVVKGIFQTQAEINAAPVHSSATRPGDIQFEDLDKDGRITANDQRIIGSAVPDYFGGMTNSISYKGISLNVFLQYTQGNEVYNNTRAFAEGMNSIFGQAASTLERWTPAKTTTTMPRAVFGDPNNNRRNSTRWLEDGSFVRLKNVLLSYSLSTSLVKKIHVSSLRFFVQGENLYTWTKYKGLDPEVSTFSVTNTSPGTDFLTFPQARTITFGLNIGL
ncbi:TonB-linked SusC/RagA family outer membrane protein [Lacibacter cauensis]|uniref:TonB-linked SusC/RagA family outer membrane protein n=1 Tax=Lacibacter cauensis TaxID=510947 RepID=A0A562SX23_9BACT|nr:TonB-dependent receptor [Lacibacter cauensis]TWI85792.1 TonB-linked SusC/RagA family outer membrane protein [Lacibacter cauensis]